MSACFLSTLLWSKPFRPRKQAIVNQGNSFTLMSFNVRRDGPEKKAINKWVNRRKSVCELLQRTKPSIICLQEVVENQFFDILYSVSGYDWVVTGRGSQWFGLAKNESLPIFYDRSRFKLLNSGWLVLNKGTANPFQWKKYGKIKRIATWVHLIDKLTEQSFFVYNVHLDHDYDAVRYSSVRVLLDHIKLYVPADETVFIAGDFNTEFNGPIKALCDTNEFMSITDPINTAIGWDRKEKYCIDYILVRPGANSLDISEYLTINTKDFPILPSDHYPVFATVTMN
jgi:endonuclease/exonuclease/phosphatase family metal-dependent hydrolase